MLLRPLYHIQDQGRHVVTIQVLSDIQKVIIQLDKEALVLRLLGSKGVNVYAKP